MYEFLRLRDRVSYGQTGSTVACDGGRQCTTGPVMAAAKSFHFVSFRRFIANVQLIDEHLLPALRIGDQDRFAARQPQPRYLLFEVIARRQCTNFTGVWRQYFGQRDQITH